MDGQYSQLSDREKRNTQRYIPLLSLLVIVYRCGLDIPYGIFDLSKRHRDILSLILYNVFYGRDAHATLGPEAQATAKGRVT